MDGFQALGIIVLVYVAYAAIVGRVYAKSGPSGRAVVRLDSPVYFWAVVAIYAGLGAALLTVF